MVPGHTKKGMKGGNGQQSRGAWENIERGDGEEGRERNGEWRGRGGGSRRGRSAITEEMTGHFCRC